MSDKINCLNCNKPVMNSFCSYCGQKTDTERITFKHFILHDILHGFWHFEKGILFTAKESLVCPGKAALDYISGKRIRYYNVFYLTLLLIGLNFFISHIQDLMTIRYLNIHEQEVDGVGKSMDDFLSNNSKTILFSFIPLFAINSFMIFRRKKLNFSEHFIISGMMFLGIMLISTITSILFFTDFIKPLNFLSDIINIATPLAMLIYLAVNYYKTFSENYKGFQLSLRVFLFMSLLVFEILMLITLMVGHFTNWTFKIK